MSTYHWFLLAFYFNFDGAFYGEIEPLSASQHRSIPHVGFLATPLLPCGRFDDPVTKFTGSDNLGPADDILTQAVQAFVHFAWRYSREQLLFCDMQGAYSIFDIVPHSIHVSICHRYPRPPWNHVLDRPTSSYVRKSQLILAC